MCWLSDRPWWRPFQTGRIAPGGSTAIGWGDLQHRRPACTGATDFYRDSRREEGTGPYDAASDPAVAYDAKHGRVG